MRAFAKNNVQNGSPNIALQKKGGDTFFGVQAKISIGKPNDKYEVEADAVADKVVSKTENNKLIPKGDPFFPAKPTAIQKSTFDEVQQKEETEEIQEKPIAEGITPVVQLATDDDEIQQKCADCEAEEQQVQKLPFEEVQTKNDTSKKSNTGNFEQNLSSSKGGGSKLSGSTKTEMESGFGTDFSNVKIHTGSQAIQMSKDLGAHAFTNGNDIYFNEGKYNPDSNTGKHLLAHELTHTIQQGASNSIQKKTKIIQKTEAEDLISNNTSYGNLDETALGISLKESLIQGNYIFVNAVFDELDWFNLDDVAYEIAVASSDTELQLIASDPLGRRLLDRLYEYLTGGNLSSDEDTQSERILNAVASQIPENEFPEDLNSIKIFPFRMPGMTVFDDAPITAERRSGGVIHIEMPVRVLGSNTYRDETSTLPDETFISGIEIPENEIIGVKLYDMGGPIVFKPALFLIRLSNETTTQVLTTIVEAIGIGLTLGAGEFVVLGAEASMAARAVLWADRAAFLIGTLTTIINEHRGWIISTFGDTGRDFIYYNSLVQSATAIYGIGRMVFGLAQLLNNFRRSFSQWRTGIAAHLDDLDTTQQSALTEIQSHTDELFENTDNIASTRRSDAPELEVEAGRRPSASPEAEEAIPAIRDGNAPLTREQMATEFAEVSSRRPGTTIDSEIEGIRYVEEVPMGEHTWRRRPDGRWCRFSIKYCLSNEDMEFLNLEIVAEESARLARDIDTSQARILRQETIDGGTIDIYEPTGNVDIDMALVVEGRILDLTDTNLNVLERFNTRNLDPDFVPPNVRTSGNRMVPNSTGETNAQIASSGRAPYLSNGDPIELHHSRQNFFSLEEQSSPFHQGSLDDLEAHPFSDDPAYISWRHSYAWFEGQLRRMGDVYDLLRTRYWRSRF